MTWTLVLAAAFSAAFSVTNSFVTLDIDKAGRIASIRERATGRELVEKPTPAIIALLDGGKQIAPKSFSHDGDRLVWHFNSGKAILSSKPFAGGWRFTLQNADVPGAKGYMVRL